MVSELTGTSGTCSRTRGWRRSSPLWTFLMSIGAGQDAARGQLATNRAISVATQRTALRSMTARAAASNPVRTSAPWSLPVGRPSSTPVANHWCGVGKPHLAGQDGEVDLVEAGVEVSTKGLDMQPRVDQPEVRRLGAQSRASQLPVPEVPGLAQMTRPSDGGDEQAARAQCPGSQRGADALIQKPLSRALSPVGAGRIELPTRRLRVCRSSTDLRPRAPAEGPVRAHPRLTVPGARAWGGRAQAHARQHQHVRLALASAGHAPSPRPRPRPDRWRDRLSEPTS